jgi:hypothetical protein
MRIVTVITLVLLSRSVTAQSQAPVKPLGVWNVEYERTISSMHSEPRTVREHGRMTVRAVGDSVFGELTIGDSGSTNRSALRGSARKDAWTLYVEQPPARGFGMVFSAVGAAMDWLRESVHGIEPVVVRFDLAVKRDSLSGSRIVTGGMGGARNSAVNGVRAREP